MAFEERFDEDDSVLLNLRVGRIIGGLLVIGAVVLIAGAAALGI